MSLNNEDELDNLPGHSRERYEPFLRQSREESSYNSIHEATVHLASEIRLLLSIGDHFLRSKDLSD